MTKPKSSGVCPICGKTLQLVAKHLQEIHWVSNATERAILNNLATGRTVIPPGPCPVTGCLPHILNLDKHLKGHKDLTQAGVERQRAHAKRDVAMAALERLWASNPQPPMADRRRPQSQVDTEQLESSSSSADSSEEAEVEEEERWTSKNGKILWSATNNQTLRYIPAARGLVPGPTQYAAARIRDPITSFSLLLTAEIIQHILAVTNLHGRREITGWRDLDVEELQAYMGLIIWPVFTGQKMNQLSEPVE
ncbi:hypothetical protein D5F01_LYC23784 [Larimichthys crocea]|uniref:PiggyBac transposable element-derived protein domain-containing protein n=1 Tax=Larimichthys crocea TaxID=215358 RepID=A0A6G0HG14_LARCR|nr:hypothetical protein D5F01_LYC23784 [Larimichthys crocea]